ncbi:MAG: hypothetical protein AAF699_16165 [Pseudomonadota bacterium]
MIVITAIYLIFRAIQPLPLVADVGTMLHGDVGRIKSLLQEHDPRRLRDGETREFQISARDINLMVNSALPAQKEQAIDVELMSKLAVIHYTLALPDNPVGDYLNLSAVLTQHEDKATLKQLSFGSATVPAWILGPTSSALNALMKALSAEYRDLIDSVKIVQFNTDSLTVLYQWRSDLAERIQSKGRNILISPQEQERILDYYAQIMDQFRRRGYEPVSLSDLLRPMFFMALQRSEISHDPVAENRALLLALGVAINGSSIRHLTGNEAASSVKTYRRPNYQLRGRGDLAKHFVISAAITATGGSTLADSIGVFKEVDDSQGGTGFSFPDLLADRAGVSFAEIALGQNAAKLQQYMSSNTSEAAYMPAFIQLPEGLMELEFKSRYEDLDSETYALVQAEIEQRIATCAIHQQDF